MNEIGQKIRILRKQQKLTLDALAGERLSKGMLSLIENGKAQPSMESLHYIANRLGVEVAELLQDGQAENLKEVLIQAEELLKQYGKSNLNKQYIEQFMVLIKPVLPQLKMQTFEQIRLQEMYYRFLANDPLNFENEKFLELAEAYRNIHAYESMLNCYSILCWKYFYQYKYTQALEYLKLAEQEMENYSWFVNATLRIDLYYNMIVIYTALFDDENTAKYLKLALDLSVEKRIFYHTDDIYRLLFSFELGQKNFDKAYKYLCKVRAMAELSDDKTSIELKTYCDLHYLNFVEKRYDEVLLEIERAKQVLHFEKDESLNAYFSIEQALAYYHLGKIDEALAIAQTIVIPSYVNHPFDLSIFYVSSAMRAKCYAQKGNKEEAKRDIYFAQDGVKKYKHSYYKEVIEQFYQDIQQIYPNI